MKKTVNFCGNCPFKYSDYDDFAVGYSTAINCTLAIFLRQKDYLILVGDGTEEVKTPNWCPLKTDEFTFNFKEFSVERTQEINSTWEQIEELNNYFNDHEYDDDFDESELEERDNKLQALYTKLGDLQNNEEEPYDFQTDLNKSIDEIKDQLLTLEEVSNKLQATLGKLGE